MKKSLASDNYSGVHPAIMESIQKANVGHVSSYGNDDYTRKAQAMLKDRLGDKAEAFFVFLGTGANVLGLSALAMSYQAVICTNYAHINVDECGAPEHFGGFKLLTIPTEDGKFNTDLAQHYLNNLGFEHNVQPKVISISQSTELGTVYSIKELGKISEFAHSNGMYLHMDGARIANAVAALNTTFKAVTTDVGVDVLSFGGTKNGMMYGEAVVLLNPQVATDFKYLRKQSMQLASKMRFIGAQFCAYLNDDLCIEMARHSNQMAAYLAKRLDEIPEVHISQSVDANAVFAMLPKHIIPELQKLSFFYVWNEDTSEVRLMTSWDTTIDDIDQFIDGFKKYLLK